MSAQPRVDLGKDEVSLCRGERGRQDLDGLDEPVHLWAVVGSTAWWGQLEHRPWVVSDGLKNDEQVINDKIIMKEPASHSHNNKTERLIINFHKRLAWLDVLETLNND